MKRKIMAFILCTAMVSALAACGGPGSTTSNSTQSNPPTANTPINNEALSGYDYASLDPVELISADTVSPGTAGQTFMELIASKADALTGGQLTIDYHGNSELGDDVDLIRQERSGDIAIHFSQTAKMVTFVPELGVFDLPMVFSKYTGDQIENVVSSPDSAFRQTMDEAFERQGFHLLGFLQNDTYRITTSNKELRTLDDFNGLQIRTQDNTSHMAFWSAIGSNPTPIAYGELFISLQNGLVDAQENAADSCAAINLQDVQKYLCITNHILFLNQLTINKDKYDNLDPAYQAALDEAVAQAIAEIRPMLKDIDMENREVLLDGGMELIEYDSDFFDAVLELPTVKDLYTKIDTEVNGLGTILQNALAEQ